MARAKIERELAADALGGASSAGRALLHKALTVLREVREHLGDAGLEAAVRSGQRSYVWTALHRGGKVRIYLTDAPAKGGGRLLRFVALQRRGTGAWDSAFGAEAATDMLMGRIGGSAENITRVLFAVERARVRCYQLAEEGTRWL